MIKIIEAKPYRRKIVVIAHNMRSMWNVGSLFRSSDAFAIEHLYLTGYTSSPPRKEISKTALDAETWVPWTKEGNPVAIIHRYRAEGYAIAALEKNEKSTSLFASIIPEKICLITGHEVLGVSDELLSLSDSILHIPMFGKKESLNVSVALGIALARLQCY
jgi:tRNA G18 (ribose-2'-O)-methylase SpoU